MSFEIMPPSGGDNINTAYAPLNTTIDADRDYKDLTGLDACAECGPAPQMITPGMGGFYEGEQLTPGMLAETPAPADNKMLWVLGGALAFWAWWAMRTPHQEYR
jgi:hypothetical protein